VYVADLIEEAKGPDLVCRIHLLVLKAQQVVGVESGHDRSRDSRVQWLSEIHPFDRSAERPPKRTETYRRAIVAGHVNGVPCRPHHLVCHSLTSPGDQVRVVCDLPRPVMNADRRSRSLLACCVNVKLPLV
jgi:hypothetical protein